MIKTISLGLGLLKGCLSVSLNRVFSRNLLCKTAWLDRSRIVSVEFELSPNSNSSPLRIRVSDLLLLVYKGNPKHIFRRIFKKKRVRLFCI